MKLDKIREILNSYDEAIKRLITLRMSIIPLVAYTKMENNLPLFQPKREEEIYKKIEEFSNENGVDKELLKNIYKLIISNALKIEEEISDNPNNTVVAEDIDILKLDNITKGFKELDSILNDEIPKIISNIVNDENLKNYNLTQKATLYYNKKIKLEET